MQISFLSRRRKYNPREIMEKCRRNSPNNSIIFQTGFRYAYKKPPQINKKHNLINIFFKKTYNIKSKNYAEISWLSNMAITKNENGYGMNE